MFFKIGILLCFIAIASANVVKSTLKGVVISYEPFVIKNDDTYSGFSIDLIALIAEKAGFQYQLYETPDGKYGVLRENGTMNGMIGEVAQKKANFATADITITSTRKGFVDFTESIMDTYLSGIVMKKHVPAGATTMKDFLNTNLTFAVLRYGSTNAAFKNSNSTVGQAFWKRISDSNGFVKSTKEGIERVKTSPTMYISQYSILEYVAGKDCELAAILDDSNIDNVQYGIAMQKGSPFLGPFNEAIKELKANEKLVELKKKYWNNLCTV